MNQPTTFELAQIAAALANGQQLNRFTAPPIVEQALCLWRACSDNLEIYDKPKGNAAVLAAIRKQLDDIAAAAPKPSKYPVPLDEVLRRIVGGKSKGDRLRTYRQFLREGRTYDPPPDLIQAGEIIAKQRKHRIAEDDYPHLCYELKRWLRNRRQENAPRRQEQSRQAAKKRWSQERRKRALEKKLRVAS